MKIMMTICAAAIAICGALSAQTATTVGLAKVHFSTPIEVGGGTVAAGDCSIEVLSGSGDSLVLEFRPDSGSAVFVMANRLSEPAGRRDEGKSAKVILSRHGDDYRFERLLMPDRSGFEVTGAVE
jgi:hypothetical protein